MERITKRNEDGAYFDGRKRWYRIMDQGEVFGEAIEVLAKYEDLEEAARTILSEETLEILKDEKEFSEWLKRMIWHVEKVNELSSQLREYTRDTPAGSRLERIKKMGVSDLAAFLDGWCPFHNEAYCHKADNTENCIECRKVILSRNDNEKKIILAENERYLCKILKYKWLCRDENGNIVAFSAKPVKNKAVGAWQVPPDVPCRVFEISKTAVFKDLTFSFIKWEDEEPWDVDTLTEE